MVLTGYRKLFREHPTRLVILLFTITLSATAIGVQRTILSLFSQQLDASLSQFVILSAAIALAIYGLFKSAGSYFGGKLSDRYGRRIISQVGILSLLLGSVLIAFSTTLLLFVVANSVIGLGIGLFFAAANIKVTDLFPSKSRVNALSLLQLSVYLGTSIGAFIAGLVADVSLRSAFIVAFILVAISFVSSLFLKETQELGEDETVPLIQETTETIRDLKSWWAEHMSTFEILDREEMEPIFDQLSAHYASSPVEEQFHIRELRHPSTLVIFSQGVVSRISDTTFILVFPLLVLSRGFTTFELGILTSVFTLTWALGMIFSGPLSDRLGRKIPMILGLSVEFFGILLLLSTVLNLLLGFTLFCVFLAGLGRGFYYPITTSIIADYVTPSHRGQAVGIYRLFLDFGYLLGGAILVLLIEPVSALSPQLSSSVFETSFVVPLLFISIQIILLILFLKDPTPRYRQLPNIKQHLHVINEGVHDVIISILQYFSEHHQEATDALQRAKEHETDADGLLEKMIKHSYRNIHPAPATMELLKFSREMDKALSYQIRSTRKLLLITEKIPVSIAKQLSKYVVILDILVQETVEVIELLGLDIGMSATMTYRVNRVEETLDLIHQELWKELMSYQGSTDLSLIMITQIIEAIEKSANIIEEAAELVRVVATKHRI